jgi:hypothetical protein
MQYDLENYRAAGRRAAKAACEAKREQRWLEHALTCEQPKDQRAARVAFNRAYRAVVEADEVGNEKK